MINPRSGFTPLHIAAHYGNENIALVLLQRGADVNYSAKVSILFLHTYTYSSFLILFVSWGDIVIIQSCVMLCLLYTAPILALPRPKVTSPATQLRNYSIYREANSVNSLNAHFTGIWE